MDQLVARKSFDLAVWKAQVLLLMSELQLFKPTGQVWKEEDNSFLAVDVNALKPIYSNHLVIFNTTILKRRIWLFCVP